jgi:hypothetical protein
MIIQRPNVGFTSSGSSTPFSLIDAVELGEIADFAARLIGIRIKFVDGNHAADMADAL